MKPIILTILFACLSSMLFGQIISYELPNLDFDSLNVESYEIKIDTVTKEVIIIKSRFDRVRVKHEYRRHRTTLNDIDTVALTINDSKGIMGMRIFLCDGVKFEFDDPFKRNTYNFNYNTHQLSMQRWSLERNYDFLLQVAESINKLIPQKEPCRAKRNLTQSGPHKSSALSYSNREKEIYSYRDNVVMASFNGSKSLDDLNENIHQHINKCIGKVEGEHLLVLHYLIGESGNVESVFFGCNCSVALRNKISECMKKTKWVPGRKGDKNVKISGSVLVGININDRYGELERRSKTIPKKKKPVIIPDDAFGSTFNGLNKIDENEVHKVVEDPPVLMKATYFDELEMEISKSFPNQDYRETLRYIVEKDGSISDINLVRSLNGEIGKWITGKMKDVRIYQAGKQRGRKVRVQTFKTLKNK